MRTIRWFLLITTALGIIFAISTFTAQAADPINNGPAAAFYIDNLPHSIDANTSQWYRFQYGGDNSLITIKMLQGADRGVQFNVFTPEQIPDWFDVKPIGRGTVLTTNCNSGIPAPGGGCQGDDLIWTGKFNTSAIYYVQVVNTNAQTVTFTLTLAGDSVSQCIQPGTVPPSNAQDAPQFCTPSETATPLASVTAVQNATRTTPATSVPNATVTTAAATAVPNVTVTATAAAATATPTRPGATGTPGPTQSAVVPTCTASCGSLANTFYTDPYHSLPINNQLQTVPGDSSIWYRFEYTGDGSMIDLDMVGGALTKLTYHIFTPDQAKTWFQETAIGQGTATSCTLQAQDTSTCGQFVNDLLWSGKFPTRGTYFVQVTNPTPGPVQFLLTVSGTGVGLCNAGQIANAPAFVPQYEGQNVLLLPCPSA